MSELPKGPTKGTGASTQSKRRTIASKLDAAGWGLFFIWVGIAWLAEINLGIALLGVAAITLGEQVARIAFKLSVEGFWVVVGSCFAIGGVWHLVEAERPIVPILLIVAGGALLLSLFRRKQREDRPIR